MKRFRYIWIILTISSCFLIEYYNLFRLKPNDFHLTLGYRFKTRFTVFFLGSLVAIVYYEIRQLNLKLSTKLRFIFGIITCIVYVQSLKYGSSYYNKKLTEYNSFFISSLQIAFLLVLMLMCSPNFFTDTFNIKLLKLAGKYSFGIYLLHPMCITETKLYLSKYIQSKVELLMYSLLMSYLAGALFFHLIEKPLMNFANNLCKKLSSCEYFHSSRH